ncbi:MAG: Dabb family protein, partial [Nitrospinaceae bacterium]|nr:Dabb family protein [Nitrospinaceae bacterium]NIR55850.1 Dabb family protein [Nitrospinaceae bacterium]NIS86303.1 Dabb family protein [Nitrospinaceae bacterium]NIT81228.1 Dabb family protein [Nitrospinaceae bacterium]NIU45342.1 Dabb family protein [Nitrospinaceae bacterium]
EVGTDFSQTERSYDVVLTTHFDDRKGLKTYSEHPVHRPVVETLRGLCSSSVVVDYES